ncbi:MAG: hypothetical protein R3C12_11280 [Planctomycetaceae bacterium]|nr:hypothetical protein [Planctomycetaceae bacterium]
MIRFRFELEALLTYRQHQLDQCRQLLAEVLAEQATCQDQRAELRAERESVESELRQRSESGRIDISHAAASRYYMTQLDVQQRGLDLQEQRILQQLDLCRQAVVQADKAVKALEKLRDKRLLVHQQQARKREELELHESWSVNSLREH